VNPVKVNAQSVNSFAVSLEQLFCSAIKDRFISAALPVSFFASETEYLSHRLKTIEKAWRNKISRKMPRVGKLLQQKPATAFAYTEGFFVYYAGFSEAFAAQSAFIGCQRMAMDNNAPSRSYLKIEEAYALLGRQPRAGDIVVDLGSAPGGWAYSALKRGAKVIAVDKSRLSVSIAAKANLKHLRQDAFTFTLNSRRTADWLFCDILAQPDTILELLAKWVRSKLCRRFIVNLKFGKTDPIALLRKITNPESGLIRDCSLLRTRQLYHDRQEFTLVGCTLP
jgi:23S rRNA (cytidine2498-2'-O)-methyltransferase